MTKKELGDMIRKKRNKIGMSQTELAKSIGKTSPAYIAFIEKGERNITAMDLIDIAKVLMTTVSELVKEDNNVLNSYEKKILKLIKNNNFITRRDMQKELNFASLSMVQRYIDRLERKGCLEKGHRVIYLKK
jgi:transcriptional regulator with XRE-family HTH domain